MLQEKAWDEGYDQAISDVIDEDYDEDFEGDYSEYEFGDVEDDEHIVTGKQIGRAHV